MSNIIKQGIMKRNLKLRTVIVAVFTFATIGLFAQTNGGVALPGAQADYANTTTQGTTYITEGMTIPAYAVPDPYFHPDNDPWGGTPDFSLTAGFTWVWSVAPAGLTFGTNNANDNYTTITAHFQVNGNCKLRLLEYFSCLGLHRLASADPVLNH